MAREERKKSSAELCPASGLRQAGPRGNPGRLAPPRAWHISLCCPWPCSEFSARWDQSFTGPRLTHSHISLSGEREQSRGGRKREPHRQQRAAASVIQQRDTTKPVCVIYFFPHQRSSRAADEAGWVSSISSQSGVQRWPGGSKCVPRLECA